MSESFVVLMWCVYMKTTSESVFYRQALAIDVAVAFQAFNAPKRLDQTTECKCLQDRSYVPIASHST